MTCLANVELDYDSRSMLGKPENADLRQQVVDKFGEDWFSWSANRVLDEAEMEWCTSHGLKLVLKRIKGMTGGAGAVIEHVKHVTQIAVPNIGLLAVDEVRLLENACTDDLQGHLDDGWRLLAICPPNSTRRPDYILGRTKTS